MYEMWSEEYGTYIYGDDLGEAIEMYKSGEVSEVHDSETGEQIVGNGVYLCE